ncbi:MAG: DUF4325 domain-containing protein [Candidatus Methanoperedens sp.]|nr:DUF4325 domain-containing protein [Candidatus Methanoperedens sp.]
MNNIVKINVVEIVGDRICVTDKDGKKVYDVIFDALSNKKEIILSFDGVTDLTSAFLNNAIGQLYGNFKEDYIKSKLSVTDMPKNDMVILKRVVDRAKSFFEDPKHFIKVADAALGDDSGN